MQLDKVLVGIVVASSLAGCASDEDGRTRDGVEVGTESQAVSARERGRRIWFENTYGGEKFFSGVLPYHPDPLKRLRVGFDAVVNTPRAQRFDVWGVINDPDCVANPAGGRDLCDDPESSGVIGIRYKGVFVDGTDMYGAACAACHAGFDPTRPPEDPNDPDWNNIHATIGNQYLDFGAVFGANLGPADVRAFMFAAWPRGAVDTTLLFSDNIMNPGVVTAFWEHETRPRFDVGLDEPTLRNGQGGEDDVGDLAAVRVYTNIGVCFQECTLPAMATGSPIDVDACRQACPDYPPQQDLDDMTVFLASHRAPQYDGGPKDGAMYARGKQVFEATCAGCHDDDGQRRHALTSDEVIALTADPANTTNACRALTSNWEAGKLWAEFSSDVYKDRVAAGERGYRVMPVAGAWATTPLLHNQSIGDWAPADATPDERVQYFEAAMWELLSPARAPKVNVLPVTIPGVALEGTPLTYIFSRDPATGAVLCTDVVENRGHHYGAGLPDADKAALIHWLRYQ